MILFLGAAGLAAATGVLLLGLAFRTGRGDAFSRIFSKRAMAGAGLLIVAASLVAAPFVLQQSAKRCTREETVNILVGRVSQARQICVEYGDGSTDAIRAAFFGIRFSPPEPTREAPFAVVVFGLEPGESVKVVIAPLGIGLQPATLTADRAGEARTDFRIPNGASLEWVVTATRTNGESMTAEVPVRK